MSDKTVCDICGGPVAGYGHNATPVVPCGTCCTFCNSAHVIPERFRQLSVALSEELPKLVKSVKEAYPKDNPDG